MTTGMSQNGPGRSGSAGPGAGATLIPGEFSPRFARMFGWYVERRLLPRRFHGVWAVRSTLGVLKGLDGEAGPVMVLLNHPSWWDPIAAALIGIRFCPSRTVSAPIDAEQLRKFAFFRRVGLFGIDPDDPASLERMAGYIDERFARDAKPTLWITPQGNFTDVRTPIRLRPGAAAIAARHPGVRVVSAALEYAFWSDAKPDLFIRFEACSAEQPTVAGWLRAMTAAMQRNQDALAALVAARDPAPFEQLVGRGVARINPMYDLWLRLRGFGGGAKGRGIEPSRASAANSLPRNARRAAP